MFHQLGASVDCLYSILINSSGPDPLLKVINDYFIFDTTSIGVLTFYTSVLYFPVIYCFYSTFCDSVVALNSAAL